MVAIARLLSLLCCCSCKLFKGWWGGKKSFQIEFAGPPGFRFSPVSFVSIGSTVPSAARSIIGSAMRSIINLFNRKDCSSNDPTITISLFRSDHDPDPVSARELDPGGQVPWLGVPILFIDCITVPTDSASAARVFLDRKIRELSMRPLSSPLRSRKHLRLGTPKTQGLRRQLILFCVATSPSNLILLLVSLIILG